MRSKSVNLGLVCGKLRLWMPVILGLVAVLAIAVPALGAGPTETNTDANAEGPPLVSVPVILDGVLYQPDEFNRIQRELNSRGIYLGFVTDPESGTELAFTSFEGLEKYAAEKLDLPSLKEMLEEAERIGPAPITMMELPEKAGGLRYVPPPSDHVDNCEDINYGGSSICVGYGVINNLHSIGWGDRISSLVTGAQAAEMIWENINQGGNYKLLLGDPAEGWYPNLHTIGWGDRASSLAVGSKS